jgi:hypothetical protein
MRNNAPRMSELGGSSPPRVVQSLSLLLLAIMYLLLNGSLYIYVELM